MKAKMNYVAFEGSETADIQVNAKTTDVSDARVSINSDVNIGAS